MKIVTTNNIDGIVGECGGDVACPEIDGIIVRTPEYQQ